MSRQQIAVIDYGMGNLHSVASALQHVCDADIAVTSDHHIVKRADRVIFPGVGAIRDCMAEIRRLGFDILVKQEIASGKPVLAICVGMQALMQHSEENGGVEGLAHFDGTVDSFSGNGVFKTASLHAKAHEGVQLKVPHMGWNNVAQTQDHALWRGIADNSRFYFVHSYFVAPSNSLIEAGRCSYGVEFTASIAQANVFATQFHPEKSHKVGLRLLQNFAKWRCE